MNDNFWNNIETKKKNFTSKELEVCELLEEDPFSFAASTATEISKRYGVSQAAVSRFCQKLGFSGYSDFRMNLMLATQTSKKHTIDSTPDYAKDLAGIIVQLSQKLDDKLLEDLAQRVLNSRNCYTSGYGASDVPASLLAFRSMLGGIHFYHMVKVHALFSCTLYVTEKLCRSNRSSAFFSAQLRLRTFCFYDTGGKT